MQLYHLLPNVVPLLTGIVTWASQRVNISISIGGSEQEYFLRVHRLGARPRELVPS